MIDLSPNILYEDKDIIAINKPAGLVVHPDGRTKELSVSEWFGVKYPESINVGEKLGGIPRPGIVHRIDRETSGVLLLAKTKEGYKCLKRQFKDREIEKIYHLFAYGKLRDDHGTLKLAIGRSAKDFRKRTIEKFARGEIREAITHYQVLKYDKESDTSFVEARPRTGRTHQIRVHFKALHHPVVADRLYASKKSAVLGFERLALHAYSNTFRTVAGDKITVEAPYPEDFKHAVDMLN